ncbi:MAG: malate dehydrogenase [Desulfurococcales archaeon ex4484_58]|nr:MAG: malate dehydrogenase [Desulfurococcales archaeon ex4484_58]
MPSSEKKRVDWYKLSNELHLKYQGKIEVVPKVPVLKLRDFAIWYTPGVAGPCKKIKEAGVDLSFEYTLRWNYAAVISDGTRVLGLGDIGPEAGLPVMEGKALLFKYLGGVDAIPLVINAKDPDKFIEVVKIVEPSFGAINLEDIASPKCFYILEKLNEILDIPVWHDDQQGTALVTLAGLLNALKIVGKKLDQVKIAFIGAGAANLAAIKYIRLAGANPKNMVVVDSKGILHPNRPDIEELKEKNPWKYRVAIETNGEGVTGGIPEAMKGADVVIAASRPGPGIIKKEWIKLMNNDPIVFAMANPVPEIWPWEAKEAGARIVATGRSDFPNQINNSLGFPAVFRGVLTVRSRKMTDSMFLAAAYAIAKYAEKKGIHEEFIVPTMDDPEMFVEEAVAVAEKAMEEGVARRKLSRDELYDEIRELVYRPKKYMDVALKNNLIEILPPYSKE